MNLLTKPSVFLLLCQKNDIYMKTIDRHGMWQMLRMYGGKLLKAVQSFYIHSRACVRVGNAVSEWFPVNLGLRQGCVMSPWLVNVHIYGWLGSRGEC